MLLPAASSKSAERLDSSASQPCQALIGIPKPTPKTVGHEGSDPGTPSYTQREVGELSDTKIVEQTLFLISHLEIRQFLYDLPVLDHVVSVRNLSRKLKILFDQ